jgi:hypothetical protein
MPIKPLEIIIKRKVAGHQWPKPVILLTWEAEIRRIEV